MELSDYRARIDQIDRQLVELFARRMNTAAGIAAYKKEHGLPVLDPVRELVAQACYSRHVGKVPRIVTAVLGGDAGLMGAASLGNVI